MDLKLFNSRILSFVNTTTNILMFVLKVSTIKKFQFYLRCQLTQLFEHDCTFSVLLRKNVW